MGTSRQDGDLFVVGDLGARTMSIPSGTVDNDDVQAAAGISATKVEHQFTKSYSQESATGAADEARVLHGVQGATGSIVAFEVGSVVANIGVAVVAIDLLKNGTTVLSSAVQLTSSHTAYEVVAATVGTTSLVDGDVLEAGIDGTAGGGTLAKGVFVNLIIREDPE